MGDSSKDIPLPEEHARRLTLFAEHTARLEARPLGLPPRCPCCGCQTLGERSALEVCPVCFWEDDGQDDHDAGVVRGGPNGSLSLAEARANYLRCGACEESMAGNVRPPEPGELPEFGPPSPSNAADGGGM